jgi:hypothetical protein
MPDLNWLAVLVAAATSFLLGGVWYGKAFLGTLWVRENAASGRMDPQTGRHPGKVFGVAIALSIGMAVLVAWVLGAAPPLEVAMKTSAKIGAVVAACFGINYAFAGRSTLLWAIDAGYHLVQCLLFGLVLGLWH